MCNACTPILVGMASLASEILLLSKWPNFPFGPWASPWVSKTFNHLESAENIHVSRGRCNMHLHQFWWVWLSSFGDNTTFKNSQISLSDHGLLSMGVKKFNRMYNKFSRKFICTEISHTHTHTPHRKIIKGGSLYHQPAPQRHSDLSSMRS